MTLGEVTYRGSRIDLLERHAVLLIPFGGMIWASIAEGGWAAVAGWGMAVIFAAAAGVLVASLARPSRLALSDEGFVLTTAFTRRGIRERWSDLAEVGLYMPPRLSLRDLPRRRAGVGYRLKSSTLSGKRQSQAMSMLGLTGWHGVVPGGWRVPTGALVDAFQRYLDAARGLESASPSASAQAGFDFAAEADKIRTLDL